MHSLFFYHLLFLLKRKLHLTKKGNHLRILGFSRFFPLFFLPVGFSSDVHHLFKFPPVSRTPFLLKHRFSQLINQEKWCYSRNWKEQSWHPTKVGIWQRGFWGKVSEGSFWQVHLQPFFHVVRMPSLSLYRLVRKVAAFCHIATQEHEQKKSKFPDHWSLSYYVLFFLQKEPQLGDGVRKKPELYLYY